MAEKKVSPDLFDLNLRQRPWHSVGHQEGQKHDSNLGGS